MKRHQMDYCQTPSGAKLMLGVGHDMVRLNRALDSLRALAYREGVAPIFTDEGTPSAGPWDMKEELLNVLAEGLARMEILRQPRSLPYVGRALQDKIELLYHDIRHHGVALERANYLYPDEAPQAIAADKHVTHWDMKDMRAYYEGSEHGPLPQVDARGAAISSPLRGNLLG